MVTNAQLLGVDDASVKASLRQDPSLSNVVNLALRRSVYDVWNFATAGFVAKHDELLERRDAGTIHEMEYATQTLGQASVSVLLTAVPGKLGTTIGTAERLTAVGGRASLARVGQVARVGAKGAVVGGATDAGVDVASQGLELAIGTREHMDLDQTAWAAGTGMVFGAAGAGSRAYLDTATVDVHRVQGGKPPAASRERIFMDNDGNISIPDTDANLNISIGTDQHAEYFRAGRRRGGNIVTFEVGVQFHEEVMSKAIPQSGARQNPANIGGTAPKVTDPSTPGTSLELPAPWVERLEGAALPRTGRVH